MYLTVNSYTDATDLLDCSLAELILFCVGNKGEVYIELVQGFGEALVGNFPGSALCAVIAKEPLQALARTASSSQSLLADVRSIPREAVSISAYPSKSSKLVSSDHASVANDGASSAMIFRSDSNGEDLEGYAAYTMFPSVIVCSIDLCIALQVRRC